MSYSHSCTQRATRRLPQENMNDFAFIRWACHSQWQEDLCRSGLASISTGKASTILGEIDNDEPQMIKFELMARELARTYVILNTMDNQPGHHRARFGESWLIRQLGLCRIMNQRHGGVRR